MPEEGTKADVVRPESSAVTAPRAGGNGGEGRTPTLEVRRLHRHFGRLKAVNDVSFTVFSGQIMGFIGPNGAGKTTTMRILATLDVPTAGDAFVYGYSVIDDADTVRRLIGYMPDSFGRYRNMNVVEYLDFFARAYGLRGAARRNAVEHVLVFTELRKLADKAVDTLSKGMSQRLCLGRALIHNPDVLILDEPAAGLDPRARVEVRELIRLLATEMHKTVLISSHILTELSEICDSATIIEAGRILASGTIAEIQNPHRERARRRMGRRLSVRVLGGSDRVERWLMEQPFVSGVQSSDDRVDFQLEGDESAQHDLLKKLIEKDFPVIEFQSERQTLEDAFMNITNGITQ